jgi:hypothetical protein
MRAVDSGEMTSNDAAGRTAVELLKALETEAWPVTKPSADATREF